MTANTKVLATAAALGLSVALLGGCSQSRTQVTWQDNGTPHISHPHQQWWNYQFVYYPASQVYFEPHSQTYYWFQNGLWRQGSELPSHIPLQFENPVTVKLESEQPFMQHHSVTKAFAFNHTPIEGSDLSSSAQAFAAYLDRYDVATFQHRWTQSEYDWIPYRSHFQPFGTPFWYNPVSNEFVTAAEYTNGSNKYNQSIDQYINQTTAGAHSDQPDF